jgi:hypothetical protein
MNSNEISHVDIGALFDPTFNTAGKMLELTKPFS